MDSKMEADFKNSPNLKAKENIFYVFDRRFEKGNDVRLSVSRTGNYDTFVAILTKTFGIGKEEKYIVTTTGREVINADSFKILDDGDTLYILQDVSQQLLQATTEKVNYLPHYDTIVKGGMYEYYASEGQNPLPYAFAELVDNALTATAENIGSRNIEIRLHLNEADASKNAIVVLDNGKGMTGRYLTNWATYRLSKFIRTDDKGRLLLDNEPEKSAEESFFPLAPRSLNSDISYFGVGGKQAIFFIGNSTRMITRHKGCQDVHELSISKEDFEQKEKNREEIYSGYIRNRKPCDTSHLATEDDILESLISEEDHRESFTAVVIGGINQDHIPYLKFKLGEWTRQLAHIYHYYLHGPNGNMPADTLGDNSPTKKTGAIPEDWFKKINIEVKLYDRKQSKPRVVYLRDISDDMQSQFIQTAAATFEFKATVEGTGIVEGILRYHPFLYDRETYPSDMNDMRAEPDPEGDHDYTYSDVKPARKRRPIFECYWNGRLIPYTMIDEFEWCSLPKKTRIPVDCYNRISGVLWTNDRFQVSTNKLTFLDIEMKLKDKNTFYSRIKGKTEKRTDLAKEFGTWLKECHEQCDKQIKFTGFEGTITRPTLPRKLQTPWAVFSQIEWDGKIFRKGSMVRISKTLPILYGSVRRFLLFGEYEGDVYTTGGQIEVQQEPRHLYDEVRVVPMSKLDRLASNAVIRKHIEEEEAKLPSKVCVTWPEGNEVTQGGSRPAGCPIGPIKIEIANKKGEFLSKLPGSQQKKLLVELKIIWHSPNGDETLVHHISQHGKTWPYWFRKMENIKNVGPYSLHLLVVLNESGANTFANKQLPFVKIKFQVAEAPPDKFTVGMLDGPFRLGSPFQIPIQLEDEYGHITKPSPALRPVVEANGLEISYVDLIIKNNSLIINGIVATGSIPVLTGKSFNLSLSLPGLQQEKQTLKIRMFPGLPKSLLVTPEEEQSVENNGSVSFTVEARDESGNRTCQPRLSVVCKMTGASGLPTSHLDISNSGYGTLTVGPISVRRMIGQQLVNATFELTGYKRVATVEREVRVTPSSMACSIDVTYHRDGAAVPITKGQEIPIIAGQYIKGLAFVLYDEGGRQKELDDTYTSKIKVNWTPKYPKEMARDGRLPDVKASTLVTESKYCYISLLDGSGVDFSFTIKSVVDAPSQMKCTYTGVKKVRLGETLPGDIVVSVMDQYGNEIKKFEKGVLKHLLVSGDGLVQHETVRMLGQQSGFNIHGVRFASGPLGRRELKIQWREMESYIKVEVVAGPPSKLSIPDWDLSQPMNVYNGCKISKPLMAQLCDEADNPTSEANVKIQLARDTGIKLLPPPQPQRTDSAGRANFGTFAVTADRGIYELQPKAFLGRSIMAGPKIQIAVEPDCNKPTSVLAEYNKDANYIVGESMPDFEVSVMAEDEALMTSAKASFLSMACWQGDNPPRMAVPENASFYPPDPIGRATSKGLFHFRKRRVPETSGFHSIMFIYNDNKNEVFSSQVVIRVAAGVPVELAPAVSPGTPTVSNTRSVAARTLLRSLTLNLKDKYGNITGSRGNSKVQIEITNDDDGGAEIPTFVGGTRQVSLSLVRGIVVIQNLVIQENSQGRDGQQYTLRCTVVTDGLPKNKMIPPYDIPFLFYNDVKKQSKMSALTKERDNLKSAIHTYTSLFETTEQLLAELKISLKEAQQEEQKLKADLRKMSISVLQLTTFSQVDRLLDITKGDQQKIYNQPRRTCQLDPGPSETDVLGKISHLAQITDHDIARVLSWHMSADMDCIVTVTSKKAHEIYRKSNGKQQVLPLDSIFKKNLPAWNKPLPHARFRPNWQPGGNPVYARDLFILPREVESCQTVFGMLLGDTLLFDTLEDANSYRQEIVKFTYCPTILTREGDRVRSNGKFGGLMNKAPPIEKLRGGVFSEPLPQEYQTLSAQIEALTAYRSAMVKRQAIEKDVQEQMQSQRTPEMKAKYQECKEAENQLKDIETKLGMTPKTTDPSLSQSKVSQWGRTESRRGQIRSHPGGDSSEQPSPKKSRGSGATVNGSGTPTRSTPRRASAATFLNEIKRKTRKT